MTDYGVTPDGFVIKDYDAILADIKAGIREKVGDDVDLSDYSLLGQIIQAFAYSLSVQWQKLEEVYTSAYPAMASDANLDAAVAVVGFTRNAATKASGTVTYSRTTIAPAPITIPAGSRVSNQSGSIIFVTVIDATLSAGTNSVNVAVIAQRPGTDSNVSAGVISHILDPVSGLESVTNAAETTGGTDAESDAMLRLRVRTYAPGAKATLLAIRNAILDVDGVTACLMSENTTAHTIAAVVLGGETADVNAAIAAARPAGISCSLNRPTEKVTTVTATVTKITGGNSTTIQANILAKLTEYFSALSIDTDVMYSSVANVILAADGVAALDTLSITMGATTITAFGQTIVISASEIATQGTHSITVN